MVSEWKEGIAESKQILIYYVQDKGSCSDSNQAAQ